MAADRFAEQNCSIARALAVVGERWTLLVVRELALGRTRFGDIRANVGVSTNVLADRLQALMDRMLTPHRAPRVEPVSVHEVLERVRSLVRAEFGVEIERDYDPSLPEILGDREQLIQAVLNIARNAAQVGSKTVIFKTRALRQVTILKQRHRLALELQVIDDGPGVPEEIQDRIFNPLVSGREGGTGLGLSLAQTFVHYHQGVIEFESRPGRTIFRILLPLT